MKFTFDKYTDKADWFVIIIPVIAFGQEDGKYSIGFGWLCFTFNIEF